MVYVGFIEGHTPTRGNKMSRNEKFYTNIKNLPEGEEYFTEHGYSQHYSWVVIRHNPKSVVLAKVEVKKDPVWTEKFQKEYLPGGFCGHSPNQGDQTWFFDKVNKDVTRTVRKNKNGWSHKNVPFSPNQCVYYYDYNF